MKLTRRDFLKGGAITALALAVGLKPNKVIRSPVVPLKHFTKGYLVSGGDFTKACYGGAAGGGKSGGSLVPPEFYTILLQGDFLEGDPNDPPLTCFGFSVIPTEKLKEVR